MTKMRKLFLLLCATLCASPGVWGQELSVSIFPAETTGSIRALNGTNNGPVATKDWQTNTATNRSAKWFKAAGIPYMRPHDASLHVGYGGHHTVDISAIFPDFSKDVNNPDSYDFHFTDEYLGLTRFCGAEIFFRLGQSIEHGSKKYGIYPPKDYKKWAQICEHIIRHYNEGWANGFHWDIRYWEIWNEPDLDSPQDRWMTDPLCWGGSEEEFFRFYCVAAKHLKKCFPELLIGGPAVTTGYIAWIDKFLGTLEREKAPLDFFSWHRYSTKPASYAKKSAVVDSLLKAHGFSRAESILDEWNYQVSWSETSPESARLRQTEVAAAFVMATLITCQNKTSVSKMMFYDYRPNTTFHITDYLSNNPTKSYYALYNWGKLLRLGGTQARADVSSEQLYAAAVKGDDGTIALLLCRYTNDLNEVYSQRVSISIAGRELKETTGLLTDSCFTNSEVPVAAEKGCLSVDLEPRSFIYICIPPDK